MACSPNPVPELPAVRVNDPAVVTDAVHQLATVGIYNPAIVANAESRHSTVGVDHSSVSDSECEKS
jgi:hypothetical protein